LEAREIRIIGFKLNLVHQLIMKLLMRGDGKRSSRQSVSNVERRTFAIFNMERVSLESQHHAL